MATLHQMKADLEPIGHALMDKRLAVPIYQRSYAWEAAHVTALYQDLSTAIDDDEDEYFLGSIVVTKSDADRIEVVDGQQRLATTSILIAAIRDYFAADGDEQRARDIERDFLVLRDRRTQERIPRLVLNEADHDYFDKKVLSEPTSKERAVAASKDSHRRIEKASEIAHDHIAALVKLGKPEVRLLDLLDFIEKRALVIWVQVPDHANAFTIFETLNDRGLDLAISDLLKNFLFLSAQNRIKEVQQHWVAMVATLVAVDNESILVNYIRHYWSSKHGATRERELYANIKANVKSKQAAVDFAKELEENAKRYAAMLNADHDLWKQYGATARQHMRTINLLQMIQIRPLLLSVLDVFSVSEARKALRLMVSWGVRFLISGGLGGGTLERHYAERAKEIREKKITTAKQLANAMEFVVPTDKQFEGAFSTARVSKSYLSRYYLQALERQKAGEKNPELVPNPNSDELNLEHVLPVNPSNDWNHIKPGEADAYYNRLGNHALMQADENSLSGNESFAVKKKAYAKSKIKLTADVAKYNTWSRADIEKRQDALATLAVKAWPIAP